MPTPTQLIAVYGEFIKKPYYVIVHSCPNEGHHRYDQYKPNRLTELVLSVLLQLTEGTAELLERMCELDESNMAVSAHRSRRYISLNRQELYPVESAHLTTESVEFKGYWIGTNANRTQAREVVELACAAANIPYQSVRKLAAFK